MRFVIVTGMSGGGKRTAMKMLEDVGYFCIDNLPVPLISKLVELVDNTESKMSNLVLGLDVRSDESFGDVEKTLEELKQSGHQYEVLFMDCSDAVLIKRYKESRRLHPLGADGNLEAAIRREREELKSIKQKADYVMDTSKLLTRELKVELDRIFVQNKSYNSLIVHVMSFGFKYGIPADADLVFDVRFLPNPFYIDELKKKTGNNQEVRDYVMQFDEANEFLEKLVDMVQFLIPNYVKEGKYQLVIAIGCTGGKHRSVTLANALYEQLKDQGEYGIQISHRDELL